MKTFESTGLGKRRRVLVLGESSLSILEETLSVSEGEDSDEDIMSDILDVTG